MGVAQTFDLTTLVKATIAGDEDAWNELVGRYAGLVAIIVRGYRLSAADAQDVSQLVWLRLVEHLVNIREPAALPGWLATTTRHECQRYLRTNNRSVSVDPLVMTQLDQADVDEVDRSLLAAEQRQVLLDGLAELQPQQRQLITLLAADPPLGYAEISRILAIPIGSIGPMRGRTLDRLRETTAVRTYLRADKADSRPAGDARPGGGRHGSELE